MGGVPVLRIQLVEGLVQASHVEFNRVGLSTLVHFDGLGKYSWPLY